MASRQRRQVVVTGMGAVTPLGTDVETTWTAALAGTSGIGPITLFDATTFACRIAGEVHGTPSYSGAVPLEPLHRSARFALASAAMAAAQAGAAGWPEDRFRIGVSLGCGRPAPDLEAMARLLNDGETTQPLDPEPMEGRSFEAGASAISRLLHAQGPSYSIYTACSSGTQAIGHAFRTIQRGGADVMIAGGYDAMVNELGIIGFLQLRALSTSNSSPESACRPFDRDRNGLVLGEGSAVLVLEELSLARARGAPILAEVSGYASSLNTQSITDPDPEAEGPAQAMRRALEDARLSPTDISYVNTHGTGTRTNDPLETVAIKRVLGHHAYAIPVSSTKSMTGHLMAAAGAVESVFCIQSIQEGMVPPTINLDRPDRECDLDYVPHRPRRATVHHVLNNSFAFGGINACLVFSRRDE